MIYLLSSKNYEEDSVVNLSLSEIVFEDFYVNLKDFDVLVFSSANAIKALFKSKSCIDFNIELFTVGASSAKEAQKLGFKKISYPEKENAKALVSDFKKRLRHKKILYLRAERIYANLNEDLKNLASEFKELIVYKNVYKKGQKIHIKRPAVFIFTAPSMLEFFLKDYELKDEDKIVVIGQSTAKAFKGYKNVFISEKADIKECINLAKSLF